ncbi:uncharacterized protein LOC124165965 isoform X2 [Ischnura elegans]|uniref:uncharacterized protein LOC124165965 isoform X2 n=1 Tax=Ischnura elegans TaxID=197161 RepID=UPI001ED884AE|nr:uncharacterized protein LOC124165965 isoform X2 [Ischnura elegans]
MDVGKETNQHRQWPKADVIELIAEYRAMPCLWDPSDPGYRDRKKRSQALHNLGVGFNTTAAEVKRKIHNLKSQLLQEMKKIEVKGSGANPDDPFATTSQWPYFKLMCATVPDLESRPFYKKMGGFNHTNSAVRKGSSASREEGTDTEDSAAQDTIDSSGWQDESPSNDLADTAPEERSEPRDPLALNTTVPNYVYVNVDSDDEEDRKPKRMRTFEEPETPAPRTTVQPPLPAVRNVNLTQDQMETEFEAFGRSVAAQLKNIPFHVALRLQLKIQTLITEERLKVMSGSRD